MNSTLTHTSRNDFIETLNHSYLASKGYGAYAYHSHNSVLMMFNQYLNQDQSEQEFIRRVIKSPLVYR